MFPLEISSTAKLLIALYRAISTRNELGLFAYAKGIPRFFASETINSDIP